MTFSTVIKAMQSHLTADNVLPVLDKVWQWTKVTLAAEWSGFIPKEDTPTLPATLPNPPVEVENPRPDGTESRKILVTNLGLFAYPLSCRAPHEGDWAKNPNIRCRSFSEGECPDTRPLSPHILPRCRRKGLSMSIVILPHRTLAIQSDAAASAGYSQRSPVVVSSRT